MQSESVSVVIPAYNAGETVVETLVSVVNQDYSVLEIIVVDDLSTDNTVEIVRQWQNENPEVGLILIELAENGGPATARNRGIESASGAWIAFLDADDAWLPSKLSVQMKILSEISDAAFVCGETLPFVKSDGGNVDCDIDEIESAVQFITLADFVAHNPVATSTVVAKRNILKLSEGFDTQFCGPEDYDLWLRLVAKHKCIMLNIPLSRYRHTVGSLSMNEQKFLPQVLRVLAKAFGEGGALCEHREYRRRAYAEQYFSASWMAYNRGANGAALKLLLISWLYDVRRLYKEQDDPMLRVKLFLRYLFSRRA
jgi:glycosyltransferase involved in cell wall biosynthesis